MTIVQHMRVFSIDPGQSFVDSLACGLLTRFGTDPAGLGDVVLLLPNRRGCRALCEAFLRQSGGRPMLLPRIEPVGDVDEDDLALSDAGPFAGGDAASGLGLPPPIPPLRRELLLARLVLQAPRLRTTDPDSPHADGLSLDNAIRLARELARLLDHVQRERLDWSGLDTLVTDDLAHHWQTAVEFLSVLIEAWPTVLEAEGCLDRQDQRNRLLEARAAAWRRSPPTGPVIVAGSTGSVPAVRDLMAVVADLPHGSIVLPGLDRFASAADWQAIRASQSHPQHGLITLLDHLQVSPDAVRAWAEGAGSADEPRRMARSRLASDVMRPAATSEGWAALGEASIPPDALDGLRRIEASEPQEEATAIALLMREALEDQGGKPTDDGRTVALATPDRDLARRVAAVLRRWAIDVDDSAGTPLIDTTPGRFLHLLATAVGERLAPVGLLALMKHPLAAAGMRRPRFVRTVRRAEAMLLRGPRPAPGIEGLRVALASWARDATARVTADGDLAPPIRTDKLDRITRRRDELARWIDDLAHALAPLLALERQGGPALLTDLLTAHVAAAEALAATTDDAGRAVAGSERLWLGDAGDAAARFLDELTEAGADLPPVPLSAWSDLLATLMAGRVVRPAWGRHPRLAIWGPLEARLQRPDLLILGGLNEGVWPGEPAADPWMSRPMRQRFGLPLPERQIGQAAHDFVQGFCCRDVVLTRSQRAEGAPTVPSRWLMRLRMVVSSLGAATACDPADSQILAWSRGLDLMDTPPPRATQPRPCPPVALRPRRLSVTHVETLLRDPYGIYARFVLGLRVLDPIDADPGAADRGRIVHKALELFVERHPATLPSDPYAALIESGRDAFANRPDRPAVMAFWWPRYARIARWVAEEERQRRAEMTEVRAESRGAVSIDGPAGPFRLTCHADRIDRRADGGLVIIDYKTATLPEVKDVQAGLSPQLALEGMIAEAGGFEAIAAASVADLRYWQITGGSTPGQDRPAGGAKQDTGALIDQARAGLRALVAAYDRAGTPYVAIPDPAVKPRYNDYAHLARFAEWGIAGDDREDA